MRLTNFLYSSLRDLDVVILGASGFTGRLVAEEMLATLPKASRIKWGIAGRSIDKMNHSLFHITSRHAVDLLKCDINNPNHLRELCQRAKVVINCVGPYRFYGEQVVDACVRHGSSYIDVSGEPQFLETMQLKYNELAIENGVTIIGACGFDSVPCDLGVQYLKKNFDGTLDAVETYLSISTGPKGTRGNVATWDSLIYSYAFRKQLNQLRTQLFSEQFKAYPKPNFPLKRKPLFKSEITNKWCVPFPGSDRSVVKRSQMYHFTHQGQRPAQVETYWVVNQASLLPPLILVKIIFNIFASFRTTRKLLEKHAKLFSAGMFDRSNPPTREQLDSCSFDMILVGKGWKEKFDDATYQPTVAYDKSAIAKVSGFDPAYLSTAMMTVQASLLLNELINKKQNTYGVLTPSFAFANTNLIDRLRKSGMSFEILTKS